MVVVDVDDGSRRVALRSRAVQASATTVRVFRSEEVAAVSVIVGRSSARVVVVILPVVMRHGAVLSGGDIRTRRALTSTSSSGPGAGPRRRQECAAERRQTRKEEGEEKEESRPYQVAETRRLVRTTGLGWSLRDGGLNPSGTYFYISPAGPELVPRRDSVRRDMGIKGMRHAVPHSLDSCAAAARESCCS